MSSDTNPDVATTLDRSQVEASKHQTRLKVALLSLPARTQAVLEFFFNSTGRSTFLPSSEDQSDAAIFDLDTLESRQHWQDFHARTGRPGIALSVHPQELPATVWVQKPVTPAALLSAAADVRLVRKQLAAPERLSPDLGSSAGSPVQPPTPAPSPSAQPHVQDGNLTHPSLASHPAQAAQAHLDEALSSLPETPPDAQLPAAPSPRSDTGTSVEADLSSGMPPPTAISTVGFAPTVPGRLEDLEPVSQVSAPSESMPRAPSPPPVAHEVARESSARRADTTGSTAGAASTRHAPAPASASASDRESQARGKGFGGMLRRWFGTSEAAPAPAAARQAAPTAAPAPAVAEPAPVAAAATTETAPAPEDSQAQVLPDHAATRTPADPIATSASAAPPPDAEPAPAPEPPAGPTATPAVDPSEHAQPVTGGVRLGVSAAAQANDSRLCGRMEDRSAQDLKEDPELRYDPEVHLVSVLREAYLVGAKWQVPTHLECAAGRVVVDATRNVLLCDFDARQLESLITTPLGKRPKTRTLNRQELADLQHTPLAGAGVQRLDETLWLAGLLTAGGRLPIDADPSRQVYLRHWPNLTRLSALPHAVRIAALWSPRGASIVETASTLGIAQRHVIAFYNAALALDLITEDGSHIRRAQRKAGRNRGLLTRLLGWLHR